MEKNCIGNFFKLNALGRKGFSLWRIQNGSSIHIPPGEK